MCGSCRGVSELFVKLRPSWVRSRFPARACVRESHSAARANAFAVLCRCAAKRGLVGKELSPGADIANADGMSTRLNRDIVHRGYTAEPHPLSMFADLNAWVLGAVFRNTHWVGSASMAASEIEGVVDNRLRVFGVKGLRVADASIIPSIPNGNVHSSVLMVASHAAGLIKADDQQQQKQ